MFRYPWKNLRKSIKNTKRYLVNSGNVDNKKVLPNHADVVIIGGGSAGCYTIYHLAKRGIKAILIERCKLTSGTTWHTNGLMWRIRPNDTDIQLLNSTRDTVIDIKNNTEYDPGWIQNGGLFIARNKIRLDEYQRLATIAKIYGIEHVMLTPDETLRIAPVLNRDAFVESLYSPGDGIIDPTMLCNALTKLAIKTSNAQVIEDCPVTEILTEQNDRGVNKIIGVRTEHGDIKTSCIVNATGVWGRDLFEPFGITIPLIPMKHSYVVSEPIEGIKGLPNIRDHDASIVFRVQGSSMYLGGYEKNPILLEKVESEFSFGLYDLDWSTFDCHVEEAVELCPAFGEAGIKCTICGPESFTPDHRPIMGPDPLMIGLFHNCGFNSAGMMYGGGCGEQLAEWIIHGRPDFYMFNFDVRRFTPKQMADKEYSIQRCHEAYAKNYSTVFAHLQPLAGRNFKTDPLHTELVLNGAVMEEKQGYERPAFFYKEKAPINIPPYDWYGAYDHPRNSDRNYLNILKGDQKYEFSDHHKRIGAEAMSCRTKAAIFNLNSFSKILIDGPDSKEAMEWICTNDINKPPNSIVYTCALNGRGGVEANFMVTVLESGDGSVTTPKFNGTAYYIVGDGAFANHILAHINDAVAEREFNATVRDVTDQMAIISIQGPNSQKIVEELTVSRLDTLTPFTSTTATMKKANSKAFCVRIMRISTMGELGYELHMDNEECVGIYNQLMDIGSQYGLKNAGFRAYNSLNCEKGHHLWGFDLRSDDTPVEANLESLCRKNGEYKGMEVIEKQRKHGVHKRLAYLTLDEKIPLWGLEGVYCNGKAVGYVRRAEFGYYINKSIGKSYIRSIDGAPIDVKRLTRGSYEIDVLGKLYSAKVHLQSLLDF
ncbi:sarcosine dehydrogenase, mitochondrial-like [Sitodiplosis mosellana]|uniref:sarcosine dehydrogenase, mitochondrial-like n=1 Tax=Sitodiplosis mosellana TaxID=263140 RepID=UPI002444A177|nr:sarcosine dehydrogenase, mitochondrial-like [Sitodiplosis mosellana]